MKKSILFAMLMSTGLANAAVSISSVYVTANDLVYDSISNRIYVSIGSGAGPNLSNSITSINPYTHQIESSTFIGSEPGKLAISSDGKYVYSALLGAFSVGQYDTTTKTKVGQFSLGSSWNGPHQAWDIAVMPGHNTTVAVTTTNACCTVSIYENGVQLPKTEPYHTSSSIAFGSANKLYGINGSTSGFEFNRMTVDATGVSFDSSTYPALGGYGTEIEYAGGLIYTTTARAFDPETLTLKGSYGLAGAFEADPEHNRMYIIPELYDEYPKQLDIYDLSTFVLLDSIKIPGASGTVSNLIRYGATGLAFNAGNKVYFIDGVVPVPIPAAFWLMGSAILGLAGTKRLK